jgi:hypothetical protein
LQLFNTYEYVTKNKQYSPFQRNLTLIVELCCVASIKEKRLKVVPNLWIHPMLAEDISRVKYTINVIHLNELGSDGFSNTMKRQGIGMLV